MKCNKKMYFLLILVLAMVIIPFKVVAEEITETPNEGEVTQPQEPVTPPVDVEEEEETPVVPETPSEEEDISEQENNSNKEEIEKVPEEEEPTKKEDTKKEEEKTNTSTRRPGINQSTTVVENTTKRVEISILDENSKLLSGVKFQIQDKNGNVFYEEETTEDVFVFEEMELGTYYLVQTSTLDGYAENKERVEFVVSEDSETVKVELKNKLETKKKKKKEKDVFGMEVPLLSSIAMFDIALCIGIIIYVKKHKNKK